MKRIIAIFDTKLQAYEGVSVFDNDQVAVRYFNSISEKIPFFADKRIIDIGEFDDVTGAIVQNDGCRELDLGGDINE